jgi:hypothetical protein
VLNQIWKRTHRLARFHFGAGLPAGFGFAEGEGSFDFSVADVTTAFSSVTTIALSSDAARIGSDARTSWLSDSGTGAPSMSMGVTCCSVLRRTGRGGGEKMVDSVEAEKAVFGVYTPDPEADIEVGTSKAAGMEIRRGGRSEGRTTSRVPCSGSGKVSRWAEDMVADRRSGSNVEERTVAKLAPVKKGSVSRSNPGSGDYDG